LSSLCPVSHDHPFFFIFYFFLGVLFVCVSVPIVGYEKKIGAKKGEVRHPRSSLTTAARQPAAVAAAVAAVRLASERPTTDDGWTSPSLSLLRYTYPAA
jgi:hypothetical protein